jgi:hypothetical protein
MRPFQGRGLLAPFSGGVAPGYYIVPLRGRGLKAAHFVAMAEDFLKGAGGELEPDQIT